MKPKDIEPIKERLFQIIGQYGYGQLLFTMIPDENDIRLLETYPAEIKAWRAFMETVYENEGEWGECDFHDVCRGFMAARGVPVEDGSYIATFCRYNLQDFDPELKNRAVEVEK